MWDEFSISVEAVDPESDSIVSFVWPHGDHPAYPSLGSTVIFRDASEQWWRRHLSEPIEEVHDDPDNTGLTPAEREIFRKQQVAMGFDPMPEHTVTLRGRWHRFWRKRRGKTPLP